MTALRKPRTEPELPDPRQALADAIEENESEQRATRSKIAALDADIQEGEKAVAKLPALQKRKAEAELQDRRDQLSDLRAHCGELRTKEDELRAALEMARHGVVRARGEVLKSSAAVQALFSRYREARAFIEAWRETLGALANAGALRTEKPQFWDVIPGTVQRVDPSWRAALDGLLTDAKTELPS